MAELGGLAFSYAAGALSTLSPCVLPLLAIILFDVLEQRAWGPLALAEASLRRSVASAYSSSRWATAWALIRPRSA